MGASQSSNNKKKALQITPRPPLRRSPTPMPSPRRATASSSPKKVFMTGKATLHKVSLASASASVSVSANGYKILKEITEQAQPNWKRGDVIGVSHQMGYRNQGLYMWTGTKAVYLDSEIDDYGSVPAEFQVGKEFPANYWSGIITHNSIVHVNFGAQAAAQINKFYRDCLLKLEQENKSHFGRNPPSLELRVNDRNWKIIANIEYYGESVKGASVVDRNGKGIMYCVNSNDPYTLAMYFS